MLGILEQQYCFEVDVGYLSGTALSLLLFSKKIQAGPAKKPTIRQSGIYFERQ